MDYLILIAVVLAGGITALFVQKHRKWLPLLISFSGAYLFAIIVFHLLPEIYGHAALAEGFSPKKAGLFLLAGLVFQLILEYFSHGIEHAHSQEENTTATLTVGAVLGLFLHAFSEGLPVHQLHSHAYLYGILVHKFPIALVLTSFLIHSGIKTRYVWLVLILFSLMTPLGTFVGENLEILRRNHVYVSAFAAGILTHISTVIIFESDMQHRLPLKKMAVILAGFLLAYFTA